MRLFHRRPDPTLLYYANLLDERDRARAVAVQLEQENAQLHATLRALGWDAEAVS